MQELQESQQLSLHESLYAPIPLVDLGENWELPTDGEKKEWDDPLNPDAECGKTKIVRSCSSNSEHPRELKPWDCCRPECPECGDRWCKRNARRAKELILNALMLAQLYMFSGLKLSSIVISVPQSLYHLTYDALQREFGKALKFLGTSHLARIFHPYRFRDKDGNEQEIKIPWRQFKAQGGYRVWSPHFHCLVIGKLIKSDVFCKRTLENLGHGWIYHKFNVDENGKHLDLNDEDVYNILYYAFTHCGISTTKERKTIVYYGVFRRTYIIDETRELVPALCEVCESPMQDTFHYHVLANGEDMFGLTQPAMKLVITRTWGLRPKKRRRVKDG